MKRFIYLLFVGFMALFVLQCTDVDLDEVKSQMAVLTSDVQTQEYSPMLVEVENRQARDFADMMVIGESDYLSIEGGMSDDAIFPYNPQTGLVENRAKNIKIYSAAIERVRRALAMEEGRFVFPSLVPSYYNMSEDLFLFIHGVVEEWNDMVGRGIAEISQDEDGSYYMEPVFIQQEYYGLVDSPVGPYYDLMSLRTMGERISAIIDVVESKPTGHYLGQHFALNFMPPLECELLIGGSVIRGYVDNGCVKFGWTNMACHHNYISYYAVTNDSKMFVQVLRNANHLCLVSCQKPK